MRYGLRRCLFLLALSALPLLSCDSQPPTAPTPPFVPPGPVVGPPAPPPVVFEDAVFVGAGDVADCNLGGAQRTGRLLDRIQGTVFMLGDGAYPQGSSESFADCYDPTWGHQRNRTRPVPGNHDYDSPRSPGYFDYFAGQIGDAGLSYYHFTLGAWSVYALDSNIATGASSSQYGWLAAQLAQDSSTCTLAYWHHPVASSSKSGGNKHMLPMWRLLVERGADVVLNGHDHVYERFAPMDGSLGFNSNGIREFVVGTGGGRLYDFETVKPLSEVRIKAWGVLELVLSNDSYSWEFVPVAGGTRSDSGDERCH